MPYVSPTPSDVAIANVLMKKTVEGKDMRYKKIHLSSKFRKTAEDGLSVLVESLGGSKIQPTLTDETHTALAWKIAAYVANARPANDVNFHNDMARVGYFLALNPDLITGRAGLSAILKQSLREKRRSRRNAARNPNFLEHIQQWRGMSVGKSFPIVWRSSEPGYYAERLTYDNLVALGMPSQDSRRAGLAHFHSLEELRRGRMNIYLLRRDTTPLVYFIVLGADLIDVYHHQPFNERSWQKLADAFVAVSRGSGLIKLRPQEQSRLAPYIVSDSTTAICE
ncbi:hypothetical protein [Hyphomicrobium sp. DY-1]|uniref:hypothetical protein n=1 Tax=Hyphomicrobium sp. DY-1 TaxID=3075650 RepID=UPI0039C4C18B